MIRKTINKKQQEIALEWPESFYGVSDRAIRKAALEKQIEKGEEPEANRLRMELWEKRYNRRGRDPEGIDYFIRAWLSMKYIYNNRNGVFHGRKMQRDLRKIQEELCLDWGRESGSQREQVLYDELYHLGGCYIDLCLSDKSYSSIIMGMGQMKASTLQNKIGQEILALAYQLPKLARMEKEFQILTQALTDCYNEKFPDAPVNLDA